MAIKLRPASMNDLDTLNRWDSEPHVVDSDPNDDWNWALELQNFPSWREQLMAELNGIPIGFIQIIDPALEETHYWGDVENNLRAIDIWIGDPQYLGQGFGSQMMSMAIERCFANPAVKAILIDPLESNQRAIKFYEKFGFRFVENRYFGRDFCHVMRLDRKTPDLARLSD